MSKRVRVVVRGLAPGVLVLETTAAHYVQRVLRLRVGAEICAIDPLRGVEADAVVTTAGRRVTLEVGEVRAGSRPGLAELSLVQALGKGDKAERVLRDAVALGVGRLRWIHTDRTVPKPASSKLERWREIAVDVARQCGRSDVPELSEPVLFDEALVESRATHRILLRPQGEAAPLADVVAELLSNGAGDSSFGVELWVGPEGGFTREEEAALVAAGARGASLGPLVLRTELAAASALAVTSCALWARQVAGRAKRALGDERW